MMRDATRMNNAPAIAFLQKVFSLQTRESRKHYLRCMLGDRHAQLELLRLGVLGDRDGEQTLVVRCFHVIAIYAGRQLDLTLKLVRDLHFHLW